MRNLIFTLWLLLPLTLLANDGSFYASGNTLIPLKETTIRLKKEILNMDRKGDWMQVDIYFEFFNPGPEKELTVGFVTPPASGDVGDDEMEHPQITDFMVMTGHEVLPYKIVRMEESGFKLGEKIAGIYDFVYHFNVKFAKGSTVIRHSYRYRGGSSVEAEAEFYYRLTTGTTWANSAIDDFELNISMEDDCFFAAPSGFGAKPANWTVVGVGKLGVSKVFNPYGDQDGGFAAQMVYLRRGKLQLRATNFKPTNDLALKVFQLHNEIHLWTDSKTRNDFDKLVDIVRGDSLETDLGKLTDQQLRLYRNLNFARKGFTFKDESLRKAFLKYGWYIPDPAITTENVKEYYISEDIMRAIRAEEARRNN